MDFSLPNAEQVLVKEDRICADCGDLNASWCNLKYGCYLCILCASVHNNLPNIEKNIKSFKLDGWNEEECSCIKGNEESDKLEEYLPSWFSKPDTNSVYPLRYEFIMNKYDRKSFSSYEAVQSEPIFQGLKEGYLHKKHNIFNKVPKYYKIKSKAIEGYASKTSGTVEESYILQNIEVTLEACNNMPYIITITTKVKDSLTKQYSLYADTVKDTVDWYYAISAAIDMYAFRVRVKQQSLITKTNRQLKNEETVLKTGYIYKTGKSAGSKWRKRWMMLKGTNLSYYEDHETLKPNGEIYIYGGPTKFEVKEGLGSEKNKPPTSHTFCLVTQNRVYKFSVFDELDKLQWIAILEKVINASPNMGGDLRANHTL